jgi:hypothetical protein
MNTKDTRKKEIIETLFSNANRVLFGLASVELKIHEGRLVSVSYSTTENSRQKEFAGSDSNTMVRTAPM